MADRGGGRDRLSRRPARQRLNPAAPSRGLFFLGPLTRRGPAAERRPPVAARFRHGGGGGRRSEGHTPDFQSLMRTSYAVSCLKTKKTKTIKIYNITHNH